MPPTATDSAKLRSFCREIGIGAIVFPARQTACKCIFSPMFPKLQNFTARTQSCARMSRWTNKTQTQTADSKS